MTLDLATVLRATGGRAFHLRPNGALQEDMLLPADLYREIGVAAVDSRQVTPGGLFVALRGERTDGHQYLVDAFGRGARVALVSDALHREVMERALRAASQVGGPGPYLVAVGDPLAALQDLARAWRRSHNAEIVGITGSIGKTTTKEIVAGALSACMPVLKTEANLNTEIGLPLTLLQLRTEHRAAVLEMGMYVPGDIRLLASIAEPRIGIVTNVAPVHLERVGSIEGIARAKSELVAALPVDGLAILNGDDPWVCAMAVTSGIARALLFGTDQACDYRVEEIEPRGLEGTTFTFNAEGRKVTVRSRVPGIHTVGAFLAAAAIMREMQIPWDDVEAALASVRIDARQRLLRNQDGVLIIDDSYNAAPPSMNAALELLRTAPGTKIAVLGDMLELGPEEEQAHRTVGERAAQIADWLIVRGPRSRWIAAGAERAGLPHDHVVEVRSNEEAADHVRAITGASAPTMQRQAIERRGTEYSVLVKASRGMSFEEVVRELTGDRV